MELIDREAALKLLDLNGVVFRREFEQLPAVEAIPIKPLSVWLAAYAAPPEYALETVIRDGNEPASIVYTVNARAKAWELHLKTLIESGLKEEEHDAE